MSSPVVASQGFLEGYFMISSIKHSSIDVLSSCGELSDVVYISTEMIDSLSRDGKNEIDGLRTITGTESGRSVKESGRGFVIGGVFYEAAP